MFGRFYCGHCSKLDDRSYSCLRGRWRSLCRNRRGNLVSCSRLGPGYVSRTKVSTAGRRCPLRSVMGGV
jgi:hypothetical protein